MNVSSIVVKTAPEKTGEVVAGINSLEFCEVHFHDKKGRVVATIEGETIHEQMENLKRIQAIPFVISAYLMYSYCEDELSDSINAIKGSGQSPV